MSTTKNMKNESKENLMWIEKYRPETLEEVVSHGEVIATLKQLSEKNQLPHLLFYGPPGSGKTSSIVAFAKNLFGSSYERSVLELNASDDRGINVVRELIIPFVSSQSWYSNSTNENSKIKLVILDESDHMTKDAQAALRRIIEKYTDNVRFCMICNYVNNIIPALQSRCMRFRFPPLKRNEVELRLAEIATKENLNFDSAGLSAIVKLSNGDMRKCLNMLQSTAMSFGSGGITEENVYTCTGNPTPSDIKQIICLLVNYDTMEAYKQFVLLKTTKSYSLVDILRELHIFIVEHDNKIESTVRMMIVEKLAEIEHQLVFVGNEKIQTAKLVGLFQVLRHSIIHKSATIPNICLFQ